MAESISAFVDIKKGESYDARKKRLASLLINTCIPPEGYLATRALAAESWAYHELRPYPYFWFGNWKTEERGTLPVCLPIARQIVLESSKWLFGKPVSIQCQDDKRLEEALNRAWMQNQMQREMHSAAQKGAIEGGIALKFCYDETRPVPLTFQTLSVIDHVRFFYDPQDKRTLLMARVQYPIRDGVTGDWYIYREEWTAEHEVHYKPILAKWLPQTVRALGGNVQVGSVAVASNNNTDPDVYQEWEELPRTPNPFGVIPIHPIRNLDKGDAFGHGDLWAGYSRNMFRLIDQVNLAFYLQNRSAQFYSEPNLIFIDAANPQVELDRPLAPGEAMNVKSRESEVGDKDMKADVKLLETRGDMMPHVMTYAKEVKRQIYEVCGSVDLDAEEITNKGNLSTPVLTFMFQPIIGAIEEKRVNYGEEGICKFLELVVGGLKNCGAFAKFLQN